MEVNWTGESRSAFRVHTQLYVSLAKVAMLIIVIPMLLEHKRGLITVTLPLFLGWFRVILTVGVHLEPSPLQYCRPSRLGRGLDRWV